MALSSPIAEWYLDYPRVSWGEAYAWEPCSSSVARPVVQVGDFDERFFMFSEETDLCYRVREAGWTVEFDPASEFVHVGGASTKPEWGRMYREQLRGHLLFLAKHGSLRQAERARRMLVRALRLRGVVFRGERGETYRSAADWLASASAQPLLESRG